MAKKSYKTPALPAMKNRGDAPKVVGKTLKKSGVWKTALYRILVGFHNTKDEAGEPFAGYTATSSAHLLGSILQIHTKDGLAQAAFYNAFLRCGLSADMRADTITGNATKWSRRNASKYADAIGVMADEAVAYFRKVYAVALAEETAKRDALIAQRKAEQEKQQQEAASK